VLFAEVPSATINSLLILGEVGGEVVDPGGAPGEPIPIDGEREGFVYSRVQCVCRAMPLAELIRLDRCSPACSRFRHVSSTSLMT